MRIKLTLLLGLVNFALVASPLSESNTAAVYLEKFHPVKAPAESGLLLRPGDHLAICGDSITQQKMYSRIIEDYLTMCVPELKVSVRQYGWNGEQVPGFLARMTNDCLRFDPTIATTCYGMNDFHYRPYQDAIGRAYRENSIKMIDIFKAHHVRVILGSPGSVSKVPHWAKQSYTTEELNLSLCRLRNIDVGIAGKEGVRFADVFWPMLTGDYVGRQEYGTNYAIPGNDGVHPHWAGHLVMAYAFLKAMGLNGDIGTFTVDMRSGKMTVSQGHKLISAKDGNYVIESSRYPFCPCEPASLAAASYPVCGKDSLDSNNSIRSGMTLVPFNQELNRLTLVVKHGKAERYRVTWGGKSKIFSATQLAKGVNLAAEFPSNPFSAAFAKVDAAIAAKQAYETKEVQDVFHEAGSRPKPTMKQISAHTDQVVEKAEKEHAALVAAVKSAFVPVIHTIRIVAE